MGYFFWGYVFLKFFNSNIPESTEAIIGSTIALAVLGFFFFHIISPSDYENAEQAYYSLKRSPDQQEKFIQDYLKSHKIK